MRNIPNPPVVTIGIILALGIIGGTALTACGRKTDDARPPEMTREVAAAEKITTSGTAPDMYSACFRGLQILMTGGGHAMVQVMDTTGKPMECK